MNRFLPLLMAAGLAACSPAYAFKTAKGHLGLLARRRPAAKAAEDLRVPEGQRRALRLVLEAREFAFDTMGLKRSKDYSTYTPVPGEAVTYSVSACEKTRFELRLFRFWPFGTYPYKGHFKRADAEREKARLEARGYDAAVTPVAAYNTFLWVSDPLPSPVLAYPPGELAALVIHELAHGTVFFRGQTAFNESAAAFLGEEGAEEFLASRPEELEALRRARRREAALEEVFDQAYRRLEELYRGPAPESEKLQKREQVFAWALDRSRELGLRLDAMNNAVLMAVRLYSTDQDLFLKAWEAQGRDWRKTVALLRSLDRKRPFEDLRLRLGTR